MPGVNRCDSANTDGSAGQDISFNVLLEVLFVLPVVSARLLI